MKIYCMSDIHGFLKEFNKALSYVEPELPKDDTQLILLGDYVHYGYDSKGVLDRIIGRQEKYGSRKVIALRGNHEDMVLEKTTGLDDMYGLRPDEKVDEKYIKWMRKQPDYYKAGNTIFVHAGIDEAAGDLWEWGTTHNVFTGLYPAPLGKIPDLDMKVVAGHNGTYAIAGDDSFNGIYYDGESHYYIDGTVMMSRYVNVLMVDTVTDRYYEVTEKGTDEVRPYENYFS